MKKVIIVVGTRPNFIKVTQFPSEFKKHKNSFEYKIVHTGQHYDDKMSKIFFEQFGIVPDIFLTADGDTVTDQMESVGKGLVKVFSEYKPDLVIVVGDVNSTATGAITANKMNIRVAHVESGLRSFDSTMPEELNRVITDNISDYFFVTEQSGIDNLIKEGKSPEKIFFVGNTMIDTMVAYETQIESSQILLELFIEAKNFILMTMHRPATVDSKEGLLKLLELISGITRKYKIVFPIHPRTEKRLKELGLYASLCENKDIVITGPLDYFSFQKLIKYAKFILTDSGGIQEESTFLGVPCLTLRPNTERPCTVAIGTNELVPFSLVEIHKKIKQIEDGKFKKGNIPPLWDGKATRRIADILVQKL